MVIGNATFNEGHTYIMGILNLTPDSFSDGGRYSETGIALKRIETMMAEGADVIDIGGESTRPGYTRISEEEEIERIAEVIRGAKNNFDIPISVDTYKPEVAEEALKLGADLINDIWGFKGENFKEKEAGCYKMAETVAKYGASCCLMHNRIVSGTGDITGTVIRDLRESADIALNAGIEADKIILDPGVGFGKDYEENLETIRNLHYICSELDLPVLLGTSRKSVIGLTLDIGKSERLEGTLATTAKASEAGCLFVRVHDIKENHRFIKMFEALRR